MPQHLAYILLKRKTSGILFRVSQTQSATGHELVSGLFTFCPDYIHAFFQRNPLRKLTGKSIVPDNEDNTLHQIGSMPGTIASDEFHKISHRADDVENWVRRVHKSGKRVNETLINTSRLESKLSENLGNNPLCQSHFASFRELVGDWQTFNHQMNELADNLAIANQKMIIDTTKKMQSILSEVCSLLKKYEQTWENYNKLVAKQQLLSKKDKTGSVVVQLEKTKTAIAKTEKELRSQSQIIVDQIPALLECRIQYLQPCLEGLIKSKVLFWGESLDSFSSHSQITSSQVISNSWGDYSSQQADLLNTISSLSIVEGSG